MSAFAPIKPSKVHFAEYIRTENKPDEGKPTPPIPEEPAKPEAQ